MGAELFVGEEGFEIGSHTTINEIMNEIAKIGVYPSIIQRSFVEGRIVLNPTKVDIYETGLEQTKKEIDELQTKVLSEDAQMFLNALESAVDYALEHGLDIEIG
jgi:hypothetical protein